MNLITTMESAKGYAQYSAAKQKLEQLQADLRVARKKLESTPWAGRPVTTKTIAEALLRGEKPVFESQSHDEPRRRAMLMIRGLEAAIEMQKRNIRDALGAIAVEIGPELRRHHEQVVSRMAKALRELSAATAEQDSLVAECDRRELGFPNMRPLGFDAARLDVPYTEAVNWMAEATEHGYQVEG